MAVGYLKFLWISSRRSQDSSGGLGGVEDAKELALDAAAGIPKTHAV